MMTSTSQELTLTFDLSAWLPSGQRVLDGVCERVAQMKRAGHVRRGDAHHEDTPGVLLTNTGPLHQAESWCGG